LFLLCGVLLARPCAAAPGEWDFTGRLNIARSYFTATLLPDGRALVVGGDDEAGNVEIYDRPTETWTFTGSLVIGRFDRRLPCYPMGRSWSPAASAPASSRTKSFPPIPCERDRQPDYRSGRPPGDVRNGRQCRHRGHYHHRKWSKEVTLPLGGYTAIVAGSGGTTGVALVEIYRLP
jgi:hypothetical protein